QLINPSTSPKELNTTLTPHSIIHGDACFAYFNKIRGIPGDGRRVYVGLENEDKVAAIDTLKNEVIATSPVGQAPQALVYVPDAVPEGLGTNNLQPLGIAGQSAELWLAPPGAKSEAKAPTSV